MSMRFTTKEFNKLKEILYIYDWGYRILRTKLDIIREDFANFHSNNPIDHIRGRLKAPESIAAKLHRFGYELTAENARKYVSDIAGIRIICPFTRDIDYLIELMRTMPDINIVGEKDYITTPKSSGYRSYHLQVEIPVFHTGKVDHVPIEIQIRTEAMNFWATLEHDAKYKYEGAIPAHLSKELVICANKIAELDKRMFLIQENILGRSNEITNEINKKKALNRHHLSTKSRAIRRTRSHLRRKKDLWD